MKKPYTPNEKNEREQLRILIKRIQDLLTRTDIAMLLLSPVREWPKIINALSKEDYARVKQMLWDEYQHNLEPIDSLEETAFILQTKIDKSITITHGTNS